MKQQRQKRFIKRWALSVLLGSLTVGALLGWSDDPMIRSIPVLTLIAILLAGLFSLPYLLIMLALIRKLGGSPAKAFMRGTLKTHLIYCSVMYGGLVLLLFDSENAGLLVLLLPYAIIGSVALCWEKQWKKKLSFIHKKTTRDI